MPETGLRTVPVRRPVLFSVRTVRSSGARGRTGLAVFVLGWRRPAGGECVIDRDAGTPGQGPVGEPVNVPFGLARAGLPEQRGDLLERDAAGALSCVAKACRRSWKRSWSGTPSTVRTVGFQTRLRKFATFTAAPAGVVNSSPHGAGAHTRRWASTADAISAGTGWSRTPTADFGGPRRAHQYRDRRPAVPVRPHRRMAPAQDLHQTRHRLPPGTAGRAGAAWAARPVGLAKRLSDQRPGYYPDRIRRT